MTSPARPRFRARTATGAIAVMSVAGLFTVGVISGEGRPTAAVDLGTGSAWFGSPGAGTVALIDGSTGSRITKVRATQPDGDFDVVQSDSSALIVDHPTGTVSRIDGSTWSRSEPVEVGSPEDDRLAVHTGGDAAWVVSQNATVVQQLDPVRLTTVGGPQSVPGEISGIAVTKDGELWVTNPRGEVRSYRDGALVNSTRLSGIEDSRLVLAADQPVVVDAAGGRAQLLDPETGDVERDLCLDIPAEPAPLLAGSTKRAPWVLAVAPLAGTLLVSHTDESRCQPIPLGEVSDSPRYGQPVEKDGWVYVPDTVAGVVIVIDPDAPEGQQIIRRVDVGLPDTAFELLAHNEHVWFDDPLGDRAGVITDDLTAIAVSKTDDANDQGTVLQPPDDPPEDAEDDPPPISCSADPALAAPGQTVLLNASAEDEQPDEWKWDVPDGDPSSAVGVQTSVVFDTLGTKVVKVTATLGGTTSTASCPVTVSDSPSEAPPPPPNATPNPNPNPDPATAPTTTAKPGGGGGGGTPPTTTLAPPRASFDVSAATVKVGQSVNVTDTTPGAHVRQWDFGAGANITAGSTTSATAGVSWGSAGTFTIRLTASNASGSGAPATRSITVIPLDAVSVPNVVGLPEAMARAAIEQKGLRVAVGPIIPSAVPGGYVAAQLPSAGGTLPEGSLVTISLSDGSPRIEVLATQPPGGEPVIGMSFAPNGDLYYVYTTGGFYHVDRTEALTGAVTSVFQIDDAENLFEPVAVDGLGNVYLTGTTFGMSEPGLFRVDGGSLTLLSTGLHFPRSMAIGPDGEVFINDTGDHAIYRYTPATGRLENLNVGSVLGGSGCGQSASDIGYVTSIAVRSNGDVAYVSQNGGCIGLWEKATGTARRIAGNGTSADDGGGAGPALNASFQFGSGEGHIAFDQSNGLLVADAVARRIRRVDLGDLASPTIKPFAGGGTTDPSSTPTPASGAQLGYMNEMAWSATKGLVFTDQDHSNRLLRVF